MMVLAKTSHLPAPGIEKELWRHGGISACDASSWACVARASLTMASLLRCMEVANEPMPACAAGGRWAFRRRRASICNAFRLLAGLWGLCLGRRPSSQCRAPAFTQQDTPRRIADDKWRRTRINFHSAALLSPKPPWVPFSPALAILPSPQWLDSSGRAAGATESSARGTIRNAVSSRVNVGCVGEAA